MVVRALLRNELLQDRIDDIRVGFDLAELIFDEFLFRFIFSVPICMSISLFLNGCIEFILFLMQFSVLLQRR